jgi:hypothetical protein
LSMELFFRFGSKFFVAKYGPCHTPLLSPPRLGKSAIKWDIQQPWY